MKNKRIILILVIMFTILNLIGVNIYAESNNIIEEQNNISEENLLNNNIMQEANSVNETIVDNTIESEEEKDTTIESEEITEDITIQEEIDSNIIQEYVNEKTVKDGVYRLAPCLDSNKAIEVAGSSKEDNAVIDIWNYGNVPAQKFNVQYENGYYKITARHSGKSLAVKDGIIKEGNQIVQETYKGLDSQKWTIRDSKINGLIISPLSNPDLVITVKGNVSNGAKIVLGKSENNNNQMFYFFNENEAERTVKNGVYKLAIGADSSKVIEVAGSSKEDNAVIDIWNYGNVPAQKFNVQYENGYYKITARHTGKSLTIKNGKLQEDTEIVQSTYEGLDTQKWIIKDSKINGLVISSLANPELAITVSGNIENGSKMVLGKNNNSNNQMIYFLNESNSEKTVSNGKYQLLIGASQGKSIEVAGSSKEDNAKVDIWDYGHVAAQQFNIEYVEDGYYKITASHTGKSLTAKNGTLQEGTEIVQSTYAGLDTQKWLIKDSGINGLTIASMVKPNLAFTIDGKINNGDKIVLKNLEKNNNQMFYFIKTVDTKQTVKNNLYKILVGANANKSIEVSGSSTENNAKVDIWDFGNSRAQKFNVEYVDGYYKIIASHSNKSLTVKENKIQNGIEIVQDDYRGDFSQKWTIRDSKINGLIISPLTRPDLAITIENRIENGSKLILTSLQKNDRQMFYFYTTNIGINIDSNKYPGVAEAVDNLTSKHPNWEFEVLYTGLDFYTAVQGEYEYDNRKANLVYTPTYKGDWIAPNPYVSGTWASASYNGIAYFMDPRNFLNDVDAFQFVDLADYANSGATLASIQYQVNGTFLNNFAEDVRISCEKQNVNPYYIIARLFQEQGKDGSATIYMDGGDGKLYFNPFNIGAVVGNDVATALAKAKAMGWDSMQKGIEGGIKFVKEGYLDAKQNTLYLNKFDVNPNSPGGFYTHQYMQNLSAAYSEARIFRGAYVDTGTLDNKIKFIIPVYENMPQTPAAKPTGEGGSTEPEGPTISDKGPMSVKVFDVSTTLKIRTGPGTQYGEIERVANGTVLLSIERLSNGWQKVITPSGNVGYASGSYLQFINDVSNCNEKIKITTSSSVNIRIGPGQNYESIKQVKNGTTGVRILKDTYYADGFCWDLVILDDGTKGFVASKYLTVI